MYDRPMASYAKRTWWTRHGLSERVQDERFLEAAVTGAFVISAADGTSSEQEYDALLDRLELLGGVDRDRIDELLAAAARDLEASGFEGRIAHIADLVEDRDAAEAVLIVAMAIALADDDVSAEEREMVTQLAAGLGLPDVDLDAMIRDLA